jgi:hypothetical protein
MVQYIKQGNLWGRIGTALGKGLADQLPEEIQRGRLSAGLKKLGEQKDLTPFQQFSGLISQPGITPQAIQSGSEILRQQGMLKGAQDRKNPDAEAFNSIKDNRNNNPDSPTKGLVDIKNTQSALQPAIPKSLSELQDRAVQLHEESPGLYPDYQSAIQGATIEDQQRLAQNAAQQTARQSQKGVETDIRRELRALESAANAKVPDNVYQKVENKALDAIAKGEKDELTAAKDARDELDSISRDYSKIDSYGNMTLLASNPKEVRSSINALRKKFKENGDEENLADAFVGRNGLSNEFAHYLAIPPTGSIQQTLKSLPSIKPHPQVTPGSGGLIGFKGIKKEERAEKSRKVIEDLAKNLNKDDSPLAIGYELGEKGYDSGMWRDYLIENQDELNLSKRQLRELEKIDKIGQGFLNDLWLKAFGGK